MDSAWQGWIRPLAIIVAVLSVGLAWWFEWLADAVVGWGVLVTAALVGGSVVAALTWEQARSLGARSTGTAIIVASVGLAAWAPVRQATEAGLLVSGDIAGDDVALSIPPAGGDGWVVHLHGEPRAGKDAAKRIRLAVHVPDRAEPWAYLDDLDTRAGKSGAPDVKKRDILWRLPADLSEGATLRVGQLGEATLEWPVHVEVRRGAPPVLPTTLLGGLLVLFALVVEARGRNRRATGLSVLAGSALVFTLLFGSWYVAGELAKSVAGALFVAAFVAAVCSLILLPVARALSPGAPAAS